MLCVMCAVLLSGCTITATSVSEAASQPAAQSTIDGDKTSASSSPDASPQPETVVYAPGRIAADGDALFEVPSEINADCFRTFTLYLTIAVQDPLESIKNVDDETAFRLSRCMLECFYRTRPDICDQVVYREAPDGFVRNYTVIPISDFLDFTATHLGLDMLDFFKNAIPADDEVVRFDEENNQILFVPSLEKAASDFDSGQLEIEGNLMFLYASSESKGECVYVFDISNNINQYLLVRVD